MNPSFQKKTKLLVFAVFVVLHVVLFNVNIAEWGDSYRILRASEYIRKLTYPTDEKRPPLFSAVLAVRPAMIDPVVWGKVVMLVISLSALLVFTKLLDLIFGSDEKAKTIGLLLFAFNPVYFYWSLRVYADVPLSLITLISFYLLIKYRKELSWQKASLLGFIVGLGVLTRFEGYLLFFSVLIELIFIDGFQPKRNFAKWFFYIIGYAVVVTPFLLWRNPLTSTYFEEPAKRVFDVDTFLIYGMSLLFLFGFVFAFGFLNKNLMTLPKKYLGISVFCALELILVLVWPAAVPRLFVPAIPFLIVFLVPGIVGFFESKHVTNKQIGAFLLLFGVYAVGQHLLRLQFLSPHRIGFILIVILQIPVIFSILKQNLRLFLITAGLSLVCWSVFTVWLHRDVYSSLVGAASYTQQNHVGVVAYNDVSAISDWYINNKGKANLSGFFIDANDKTNLTSAFLTKHAVSYLLLTNEHNSELTLDLKKRPYLVLEKEFSYMHGGKRFWSWVINVN